MFRRLLHFIPLLSFAGVAYAQDHTGDVFKVEIKDLRPTQLSVGLYEVEIKTKKLQDLKDEEGKSELKKYLKENPLDVVIDPKGEIYVVDGHHLARAVYEMGRDSLYARVIVDYSKAGISQEEFWRRMIKQNRVYLKDETGTVSIEPKDLPTRIKDLIDNPFRSLAWLVRQAGGYRNLLKPFQEFFWAVFFRERLGFLKLKSKKDYEEAVPVAVQLAKSIESAGLPGSYARKSAPEFLEALTCSELFAP